MQHFTELFTHGYMQHKRVSGGPKGLDSAPQGSARHINNADINWLMCNQEA